MVGVSEAVECPTLARYYIQYSDTLIIISSPRNLSRPDAIITLDKSVYAASTRNPEKQVGEGVSVIYSCISQLSAIDKSRLLRSSARFS